MVVTTELPIVDDVGDRYSVNFPHLGTREIRDPNFAFGGDGNDFATRLLIDAPASPDIPKVALSLATEARWHQPLVTNNVASIVDQAPDDVLSRSLEPPASPTEWKWSTELQGDNRIGAKDLEVNAVVQRPAVEAEMSRKQFFGAVFLGIAGGFMVLFLEMSHAAAKGWVRTRD